MALSASTPLRITAADKVSRHNYPMVASAQVYQGSALGFSAGNVRALTAGDGFAGFSTEEKLNTSTAGEKTIEAITRGVLEEVSITGATGVINCIPPNNDVYMSDDGTFTLTIGSNTKIGHIIGYNASTGKFSVYFEAIGWRSNT